MSQAPQPSQITLTFSRAELWTLYRVLFDRLERRRRSEAPEPLPLELYQTYEKIEAGEGVFTAAELLSTRAELKRYLERDAVTRRERVDIEQIINQITATLSGNPSARPFVGRSPRRRSR